RGLFGKRKNPAHIEKVLKQLSLWDKKDDQIRALSGGMKRRLLIAKALSHEPQILFLDEPTAHFDLRSEAEFLERLKVLARGDKTIIVSTHRTSLLALVDRLLVFEQGQLIGDGPRDQIIARLQAAARGPTYQPQALAETNATV
ncbi:MAG TPA: ATP-binding cassette domain-containing protein, partial [Chthoniobacterales bacterium]|nr:ATP-binding cassette domain-containing protein [Chthoniobacterales bacterium]